MCTTQQSCFSLKAVPARVANLSCGSRTPLPHASHSCSPWPWVRGARFGRRRRLRRHVRRMVARRSTFRRTSPLSSTDPLANPLTGPCAQSARATCREEFLRGNGNWGFPRRELAKSWRSRNRIELRPPLRIPDNVARMDITMNGPPRHAAATRHPRAFPAAPRASTLTIPGSVSSREARIHAA